MLLIGRWTLDPIDGTKGFLRGGQYAVCLALIVDGRVVLGVIGCPNLPVKSAEPDGPRGCIFVAVKDQGAEQVRQRTSYPFAFRLLSFSFSRARIDDALGRSLGAVDDLPCCTRGAQFFGIRRGRARGSRV